ncbi:MAG: rod shape-determining protein MreD [Bacteroidaceae bacterium]|jgi:rod shape-determining protein MreD|nr:rod shape-determining protein MreD [Bacteroidaceae bacterium]
MNSNVLMRIGRLFILLLLQVLVFNHIHLFGYITPLVIGYMVVCFHRGSSRVEILIWAFAIGLLFDIFSNTAGMAAAACTLIAMIQPLLLNRMAPRDAEEGFIPSFTTLKFWNYTFYVFLLMLVLHGCFYLLDAFTLMDWQLTLVSIGGSSVFATLIIICIELIVHVRKDFEHHS